MITPIDLKVKEAMRTFFKDRMQEEKDKTAGSALGFVVYEKEIEQFVDKLWVHINKQKLNEQNGAKE